MCIRDSRWTSSDAGLTIKKESNRLVIPLRAANPDIESKNLAVNIFVNNKKERKIIFNDNEWKETVIDVSGYYGENISVIFSCSMTSVSYTHLDVYKRQI